MAVSARARREDNFRENGIQDGWENDSGGQYPSMEYLFTVHDSECAVVVTWIESILVWFVLFMFVVIGY